MFLLDIILSNAACALIFFLFLLIVGISSYVMVRNNKKVIVENEKEEKTEMYETLEKVLKELNCRFTHELKENWHEYSFKFQSGNFILIFQQDEDFVRIHYPRFFSTTIDYLDLVRQVINDCNSRNFSHHLVYSTNGKENMVTVHITSSFTFVEDLTKNAERLSATLSQIFSIAQDFYIHFERNKERSHEVSTNDIERDFATYEREYFLLKEGEKAVHDPEDLLRSSVSNPLTLSSLLQNLYDWKNPEFLELKVVNHTTKTFLTEEEIADFDICSALVANDNDGHAQFIGQNAALILIYTEDKNHPEHLPSLLTIALQSEGRTPEILYMRATMSLTPKGTQNKNALEISTSRNLSSSFIFAFDTASAEQKRAELKFMKDELEQKIKDEDLDQLTPEEQIIYKFKVPNLLANIHYGEQLYRQKRYYEATIQLEAIYQFLNKFFHNLDKKQRQYFYDVCYYIGACYSRIGLYKKAYYYLDAIFSLNNFTYMEEYVNCLVNDRDHRTLGIIENLINYTNRRMEESMEETPDYLIHFKKFLLRRKSFALIDAGALDAAQEICEKMLNDPDNQDFALNELAHIQKLYEQTEQKEEDTSKDNNSTPEENK